jgi:hypothetical protein
VNRLREGILSNLILASRQPVEPSHHQRVALAKLRQHAAQLHFVGTCLAGPFLAMLREC